MRLFLNLLLVVVLMPACAWAQTENNGRTVYNSRSSNGAVPIYNSPGSSYGTGGPISLKQLVRGNSNAADGSRSYSYSNSAGIDPYGNSKNYSLSLSPAQVRESRARQEAAYQREQFEFERLAAQAARENSFGQQPLNQASSTSSSAGSTFAPRRAFQNKNNDTFEMPRRVFNSVR